MKKLTAIHLSWGETSAIFSAMLSKLLGKSVKCTASADDYDYWAIRTDIGINDADMGRVCVHAGLIGEGLVVELPSYYDEDFTHSISMTLAEKLLSKELGISFEYTHIDKEGGLYFIGCNLDETKTNYEKAVRANIEELLPQLYQGPERSDDLMDCGYADGCYDTWISVLEMMGVSHAYKKSDVFNYSIDAPEEEPPEEARNNIKSFADVKEGDVVVVFDENSHDYVEHRIRIESVEYDKENICEDNPTGKVCYGTDLDYEGLEDEITVVSVANFNRIIKIVELEDAWAELVDVTNEDYYKNPKITYLDGVEDECWELFKSYAEMVGARFPKDGEVDYDIAKTISEKIIKLVEEVFGVPFPMPKEG